MIAARQLGGALGVALCASVVVEIADPIEAFHAVFIVCGAFVVPLVAFGLLLNRKTAKG